MHRTMETDRLPGTDVSSAVGL
uniref:Uncharacterized protein n=1 Tax=Arundo donax TaxID=35708 RepID=A0A0A9ANB6_ARUDO